jgi:hypothetical protein
MEDGTGEIAWRANQKATHPKCIAFQVVNLIVALWQNYKKKKK